MGLRIRTTIPGRTRPANLTTSSRSSLADTVDNIWPQCGPDNAVLSERFFKRKDAVENFLAKQVREGKMSLADAQKGIATDWTQFLAASEGCDGAACE